MTGGRASHVVGSRHADRLEAVEGLLRTRRAQVRRQIGVVQALAVGPRELAAGVGTRAEGDRRIAIGDKPVFEVARQCTDGALLWGTPGVGSDHTQAAASAQPGVGRLRPGLARIE